MSSLEMVSLIFLLITLSCTVKANTDPEKDAERYCVGNEALGMENGQINDSQILSSSFLNGYPARFARLNSPNPWAAATVDWNQWIQVCFIESVVFTAIAIQGGGLAEATDGGFRPVHWVTSYAVSFSFDGQTFQNYTVNGIRKVFPGNTDENMVVTNTLTPPITARYIWIHPVTWHISIRMRIELYTCGIHSNAIYDDCVEAHRKACQATEGRYLIKSRTTIGFERTECHSADGAYIGSGCTGSGWTLIGKLKGDNSNDNTSYDSAIWTAKGSDQTNFNSQFWSANVTEVCLTSDAFSIQFPVQAPSLRSLFFQKNTLNISKDLWIDALEDNVTEPAFEENCYETGFNVGDPNYVQARIGIVNLNNTEAECTPSGPQAIGVGIKVAGQGYGSVHGVVAGNNIDDAYHNVSVYVRSKP